MSHILFYPVGSNEELLEGTTTTSPDTSGKTIGAPKIIPRITEVTDDEDQSITIEKNSPSDPGTIRYTVDGTVPNEDSPEYEDELSASQLLEDSHDEEVTIAAGVENEGKMSEIAIGKVKKITVTP